MDLSKLTDEELLAYKNGGLQALSDDAMLRLSGREKDVEPQGLRTFMQGASLGWSDEIEAAVRSVLPEDFGGGEYKVIRDELRSKLADYKKQNPGTALTQEIAGSLATAIPAFFATGGASAPLTMANVAKSGIAYGSASGLGTSESETLTGQAIDTGVGATTGAITGMAGKAIGKGFGDFIGYTKAKLGATSSQAVQREIQRLQEVTGKSKEEILLDLSEGRLMSDNKTLAVALKNYANQGGEAGRAVIERTGQRASETRQEAMSGLQSAFTGKSDPNITKAFKMSQDDIRKGEAEAYKEIFKFGNSEVGGDIVQLMDEAGKTVPSLAKKLNESYSVSKLAPLFKFNDDGSVELFRQPTLQDSELMNRMLRDVYTSKDAWRENAPLAEAVSNIKNSLQSAIDNQSPVLAQTRQNWAKMMQANEAFNMGRKAVNMPSEELEILVDSLKSKPEALSALQQGFMAGVKNKAGVTKTTFRNIADQDNKLGQNARIIAGEKFTPSIEQKAQLAADTQEIKQFMPRTAGSPTAALQQENIAQGLTSTAREYAQGGDVGMVFNVIAKGVDKWQQRNRLNLTDEQKLQVVDTIFSNQPKTVERMLNQPEVFNSMQKNIDKYIDYLIKPAQFQAVDAATGEDQ
jgi:hypothetical protein